MKSSHMRRTALVVALGMCMASGTVYAQSRSAGTIFGEATAGSNVVAVSNDTGLTRSVTVGANGHYQMAAMPIGTYTVSVKKDGATVGTRNNVTVSVGGIEVDFGAANAQELGGVTVTSNALPAIDVSSVISQTSLTAQTLDRVPVARDITQAAVLAPSVIPADSRYGNSVSFGGAAASENAYFINGYPVTNALTNIGSTSLPFDAIRSEQVITGGYGARYGRSTGGVINIVTKAGTNEWKAGVLAIWTPASLRASRKDIYYPTGTGASSDGSIYQDYLGYSSNPFTYGAYVSGPIIKDRLFMYVSGQWEQNNFEYNGVAHANPATNFTVDKRKHPLWIAKIDWNINDSNVLELTGISDKTGINRSLYSYDYATATHGTTKNGGFRYKDGGELYIGKYTGYWTDNLTVSALYGQQKVLHYSAPLGYDPTQVRVADDRPAHAANPVTGLQPYSTLPDPKAYDKTDGWRIDADWRLGAHDISFGYNVANSESRAGTAMSGPGYQWIYYTASATGETDQGGYHTCPSCDYVDKYIYANGGTFKVEQAAYYIQDRWQVTDNVLLSLGLRNDKFTNYNADGVAYVSQDNLWAPRLGFSWDVFGDSSLKIYGSAGRYFLAMPLNVAVRGAAGSTYTETYYTFTSIDPTTGVPTIGSKIGGPYSANNEFGQAPDPRSVAAKGLNPHYQDEYIVGMKQMITPSLTWGARLQYRDLKSAIDDECDNRPMLKYMAENNIAVDPNYNYQPNCRLFNPGDDNVMLLDIPDAAGSTDLVAVPYSAKDMGIYMKRRYLGLNLFLEHPYDGKWYGRVEYTLSHNWGNDEGQLDSDIGQGDVSQTVLYDHHELMAYGGGNLPNDRRHVLKAYGYYSLTPEWMVGGVLVARTGRPKNCLGYYSGADKDAYNPPQDTGTATGREFFEQHLNYGPYYHYCNGKPVPRGTAGRLPSDFQLSLNVAYTPDWAPGLKMKVDVMNVLNKQVAQNVREIGELGGPGVEYSQHGRVISYDSPRMFRFTLRYDFSM